MIRELKEKKQKEWRSYLKGKRKEDRRNNCENYKVQHLFFTPCIYFLKCNESIVYIGQTESLMTRISQHISENTKIFTHFDMYPFIGSYKQRLHEEKRLIRQYKPIYNIIHNK